LTEEFGELDQFSSKQGFDLEVEIAREATASGVTLSPAAVELLAAHARDVLRANDEFKLTSITAPDEFVARHLGEAFQGASLIEAGTEGTLLDLGSGNGYPGLPLAAAHPGLRPVLAEASKRKAGFLRGVLERYFNTGEVLDVHVQRAADLEAVVPARVIVTRAMSNWERILPRLRTTLTDDGELLVWAGERMDVLLSRSAWRGYKLITRHLLRGRTQSWIWLFRRDDTRS
jgi:16S rRNA (guanine527-N7)-methyltransferase